MTDLYDVFGTDQRHLEQSLEMLKQIIPRHTSAGGVVDTAKLLTELEHDPNMLSLLQSALQNQQDNQRALTHIMIFGWDKNKHIHSHEHLLCFGETLTGKENRYLAKDELQIKYASSSPSFSNVVKDYEVQDLALFDELIRAKNWDRDSQQLEKVIDLGKLIFSERLTRLSSFSASSKIVYYELSTRTNFVFGAS